MTIRRYHADCCVPMNGIGKPGELAPTVLFLASEGARYISGQVVPIDGERTAQ